MNKLLMLLFIISCISCEVTDNYILKPDIEYINYSTPELNGIHYTVINTSAGFTFNNVYYKLPIEDCDIIIEQIATSKGFNTYVLYLQYTINNYIIIDYIVKYNNKPIILTLHYGVPNNNTFEYINNVDVILFN